MQQDLLASSAWLLTAPTPKTPGQQLGPRFRQRYAEIPADYLDFLQRFSSLQTRNQTLWFNSVQDFNEETPGSAFAWNEFEQQSLQAFDGDEAGQQQVRHFWDAHLPILLSVHGHYAYVALGVAEHNWGQIFEGEEPEYEEAQCIAPSFGQWLNSWIGSALQADLQADLRHRSNQDAL